MIQRSNSGFAFPFLVGATLGVLGGAVLGMFVAQRAFRLADQIISKVHRDDADDGLRLDLLLQ